MTREEFDRTVKNYEGLFNPFTTKVGDLDSTRVSIDIPAEIHQLLRNISVDKGFFQRSLSMFIFTMADFCKEKQIDYYSPLNAKELYDFVRFRCTLVDVTSTGHGGNDSRRTEKTPARTTRRRKQRASTKSTDSEKDT